jgi:hypothetical protein
MKLQVISVKRNNESKLVFKKIPKLRQVTPKVPVNSKVLVSKFYDSDVFLRQVLNNKKVRIYNSTSDVIDEVDLNQVALTESGVSKKPLKKNKVNKNHKKVVKKPIKTLEKRKNVKKNRKIKKSH